MKFFKIITECTENVYRFYAIGKNKKDVMKRWEGNGKYVAVEDVTSEVIIKPDKLISDLRKCGWDEIQISLLNELILEYNNENALPY